MRLSLISIVAVYALVTIVFGTTYFLQRTSYSGFLWDVIWAGLSWPRALLQFMEFVS